MFFDPHPPARLILAMPLKFHKTKEILPHPRGWQLRYLMVENDTGNNIQAKELESGVKKQM